MSKLKATVDALVFTIIFGVSVFIAIPALAALLALGIISSELKAKAEDGIRSAKGLHRDKAWDYYQRTGDVPGTLFMLVLGCLPS